MAEGYFDLDEDEGACRILISPEVDQFLRSAPSNDRRHARKALQILKRLKTHGQEAINNTEQFKLEGRYPTGRGQPKQQAVWVVKAYQIRIYGGFGTQGTTPVFFCVEATKKKKDKADKRQLERVARAVGVKR